MLVECFFILSKGDSLVYQGGGDIIAPAIALPTNGLLQSRSLLCVKYVRCFTGYLRK